MSAYPASIKVGRLCGQPSKRLGADREAFLYHLRLDASEMAAEARVTSAPLRVSVVIPTHNRPGLLKAAVGSVLKQAIDGVEIVVVDDGSEPPAKLDLEGLTLVRQQTPAGPAAARNRGVAAASAPVIAFLDDDDRFLSGKLARCLGCLEQSPEAVAVIHRSAYSPAPPTGNREVRLEYNAQSLMLHQQPPHLAGVVVRRNAHLEVLFDESFQGAEDLDYLIRLAATGPFVVLDEVLSELGAGQMSAVSLESRIEARLRLGQKHAHLFDREAKSFFFLRLGHLQRRAGHRSASLSAFAKSVWFRPAQLSAWKGLAMAMVSPEFVDRAIARRPS